MSITLTLPEWAWWLVGLVLVGMIVNDVLRIVSWHLDRKIKARQSRPDAWGYIYSHIANPDTKS